MPQLGVVGYTKEKNFVTFEGTPQLQVEWYQKILKSRAFMPFFEKVW